MYERVKSGIPGLDPLIGGGFIKNSVNLITGGTGTGKTIFCCQFLWHGLSKGEPCVFLSLEDYPEDIKEDVAQFGWDFGKFEKKGLFKIEYHDPFEVADVASVLIDKITEIKAQRLVIDSASIIGLYLKEPVSIRKKLFKVLMAVKNAGCTALVTSETLEDTKALSRFGVEEFVVDSVVVLYYTSIGTETFGNVEIRKMRRTKHARGIFPTTIAKNGMAVSKERVVLMK